MNAELTAPVVAAPSAISYQDGNFPQPFEVSGEYIENLKKAYADAVER